MAKGDFDNLSGAGKPLPERVVYNPYSDFTTHKMNEILVEGGFAPEWVTLQKEIRMKSEEIVKKLEKKRRTLGSDPLDDEKRKEWEKFCSDLDESGVKQINKDIAKFNLLVPIFTKQMFQFDIKKEAKKILDKGCDAFPEDRKEIINSKKCDNNEDTNSRDNKYLHMLKQFLIGLK